MWPHADREVERLAEAVQRIAWQADDQAEPQAELRNGRHQLPHALSVASRVEMTPHRPQRLRCRALEAEGELVVTELCQQVDRVGVEQFRVHLEDNRLVLRVDRRDEREQCLRAALVEQDVAVGDVDPPDVGMGEQTSQVRLHDVEGAKSGPEAISPGAEPAPERAAARGFERRRHGSRHGIEVVEVVHVLGLRWEHGEVVQTGRRIRGELPAIAAMEPGHVHRFPPGQPGR